MTQVWSIRQNVPFAFEKKVYSSAFGQNVLKISVRSISSNVSFKTCISLLILCFDVLSIGVSGVWNLLLLLCYCQFLLLCLLVFVLCIEVLLCWVPRYLQLLCLPLRLIPWSLCTVLPYLCNLLYFKVYPVWYEDCSSSFLLLPICMEYIFLSSHFQSICVFRSEVGFL